MEELIFYSTACKFFLLNDWAGHEYCLHGPNVHVNKTTNDHLLNQLKLSFENYSKVVRDTYSNLLTMTTTWNLKTAGQ